MNAIYHFTISQNSPNYVINLAKPCRKICCIFTEPIYDRLIIDDIESNILIKGGVFHFSFPSGINKITVSGSGEIINSHEGTIFIEEWGN